ncbi:RidA family protein [Trichloromonas sp.]|uniref:RidA family protein n=1 Tax=Trichloromonas sp. TaxID=3069249 RepID=UPI002A3E9148|nr:RidA family protein [Trichloromonas sp.]
MSIEKIATTAAPAAIGPYSQGVQAGDYLFFSGQIPLDPKTGEMVSGGIEAQTRQVLANMEEVLAAAGLDFGKVVKTTIFLADLGDFALVNELYGARFSGIYPARSTIQVAALPKGAAIEIEWVAYRGA